jgi:hypothetical protein
MVESASGESTSLEKLSIDNPSDFRFHAAYLTYSDIFDKASSLEIRKQLNSNIVALQRNEIDYSTFYKNISQYRGEGDSQYRYGRAVIRTQRKREWHRKMQKRERNRRHKK